MGAPLLDDGIQFFRVGPKVALHDVEVVYLTEQERDRRFVSSAADLRELDYKEMLVNQNIGPD